MFKTPAFVLTSLPILTSALIACSNPPPGPDYGDTDGGRPGSAGSSTSSSGSGTSGSTSSGGTGTIGSGAGGSSGSSPAAAGSAGTDAGGSGTGSVPGVLGHPSSALTYPTYPGFTLYLAEEFEQPLDLVNDPIWTYSDGGLPEGNVRFVKDAISFGDGLMRITVRSESHPSGDSFAENGTVFSKPLRSGELRTKFNNFRYGRYEARLKAPHPAGAPGVNGNFIHTLFVFRTPKTEQWREIDIEVTGNSPSALTTNVLFGDNLQGWSPDIQEALSDIAPAGFDSRSDFHLYAFEWTPTEIRWSIDNQIVRTKNATNIPIPELSAKIMMNLWIFPSDGFGGDPTTNVYPMTAEYDYFRFYRLDTETEYPCSPTPSCLPAGDLNLSKNNPEDGVP